MDRERLEELDERACRRGFMTGIARGGGGLIHVGRGFRSLCGGRPMTKGFTLSGLLHAGRANEVCDLCLERMEGDEGEH